MNSYVDFYEDGYQVFTNVLNKNEILKLKTKIDLIYEQQIKEFGLDNLRIIGETNMVRSPLIYDSEFIQLIQKPLIKLIIEQILGVYAILSLQNSIIVPAHSSHHQSFYHRDIIHQDFTSSRPIGINIYFCLDDYNKESGGTIFLPKSHKMENIPNPATRNLIEASPNAPAGSIILFDSMIYHKAGENKTSEARYGINNMFTLPFVKQQISYPRILGEKYKNDIALERLLGYDSKEYLDVFEFRHRRLTRSQN